ncbi:hypothetical protein [Sphaerotilus microaerophilus]|uniref:Uncharacterized protein n=1 Tax=Sphaerotilus microaerophilus TaxID=2914710 RepID=A0ABN6PTD0_9BURK|nr:hypothetical protein [Sphaerotilus sp. FB-5]BDI06356.1 hypothetical protein CATMQ487_33260 [Sphaerotilus sp. FB-5]
MKLMLSGEGPTDLGVMRPEAGGTRFVPGPMAWIVDRLAENRLGYSLLELAEAGGDALRVVHKTELAQHARSGPTLLPGLKRGKGTAFYFRNAQVLGRLAQTQQAESGEPVLAVLFRDGDGTRSVPSHEWQDKFDSMVNGFKQAGFDAGVPMVPRPKSEAWLLCGLKTQPYQHCGELEDAPGNDGSPHNLKNRLKALNGGIEPSADVQAGWIRDGTVDPRRIDMPSFEAFRRELDRACGAALTRNTNDRTQAGAA